MWVDADPDITTRKSIFGKMNPFNSPDTAWAPSKLRVGGGDPFGIVSTNIWLDSREGKDWLGRIDSEKLILQSLHSIYGHYEGEGEGNNVTLDCCEDTRSSIDTLRIVGMNLK